MAVTYMFSTQELQNLIARSKAMARLSPDLQSQVDRSLGNPTSPKAQALYRILIDELQQYKEIEKEYLQESNKIVAEFQVEITAKFTKKLREEHHQAEQKARQAEDNTAQKLLNSLNQK